MRKVLGMLLVLALLAGAAWWLWPTLAEAWQPALERGATTAPETTVDVGDVAADAPSLQAAADATPAVPAPTALPDTLPPLPPVDAPLAESMTDLLARAHAGDATAACHLKVAAERCRSLQQSTAMAQAMESSLVDGSFDGGEMVGVRMIASMEVEGDSSDALCAGVDPDALPGGSDLLERTLANLSPRQKTLMALLRSDGTLARMSRQLGGGVGGFGVDASDLVSQFLADHDMAFLQAGFDAGDPLALEGLLLVHAPGGMLGGGPFNMTRQSRPDPYRFARYALLGQELLGAEWLGERATPVLDQVLAAMPPEDRTRLDAQVAADTARWQSAEQAHGPRVPPEPNADALDLCRG